ncbi:hypothetical protein PQR64_03975 [Paraburkholderia phytofirmans]|uniref:hypothetical protein n=1 Tax=Paraburkholderia phytofirmans TaxID=261302 RepID=UPI0038B7067B
MVSRARRRAAAQRARCGARSRGGGDAGKIADTLFGHYRRAVGWGRARQSTANQDASYELLVRAH